MGYQVGDTVIFKEYDAPLGQVCIAAGTRAKVVGVEEPCFWVRLVGGGMVRVMEEHVEAEGTEARG